MPTFKCPEGHETDAKNKPAKCPHYHLGSPCAAEVTQFGKGARKGSKEAGK